MRLFMLTASVVWITTAMTWGQVIQPLESSTIGLPAATAAPTLQVPPGSTTAPVLGPIVGQGFDPYCPPVVGAPAAACVCEPSGIIAGGGAYLLQPAWSSNPAFVRNDGAGNFSSFDFEYDTEFAPLVWLGYISETGAGVRARYWTFDGSASETAAGPNVTAPFFFGPISGNPDLFLENELQLDVLDAEAMYVRRINQFTRITTFGVRLAQLEQSFSARSYPDPAAPIADPGGVEAAFSTNEFEGVGPTISFELQRQIGGSALSTYGLLRGSILFGEHEERVQIDELNPANSVTFSRSYDDVIPVGEVEAGALLRFPGATSWFFKVGFVGQVWAGVGSASGLTSDLDSGGNLGFLGLRLSGGLNY